MWTYINPASYPTPNTEPVPPAGEIDWPTSCPSHCVDILQQPSRNSPCTYVAIPPPETPNRFGTGMHVLESTASRGELFYSGKGACVNDMSGNPLNILGVVASYGRSVIAAPAQQRSIPTSRLGDRCIEVKVSVSCEAKLHDPRKSVKEPAGLQMPTPCYTFQRHLVVGVRPAAIIIPAFTPLHVHRLQYPHTTTTNAARDRWNCNSHNASAQPTRSFHLKRSAVTPRRHHLPPAFGLP